MHHMEYPYDAGWVQILYFERRRLPTSGAYGMQSLNARTNGDEKVEMIGCGRVGEETVAD